MATVGTATVIARTDGTLNVLVFPRGRVGAVAGVTLTREEAAELREALDTVLRGAE